MNRIASVTLCLLFGSLIAAGAGAATVKVAAVQFGPVEGNPTINRQKLVQLTTQAAEAGAKIVVHTEMATSGYSFFSRQQISGVAEPIPGPSTAALGAVAKQYGIYVAFGLPEYDATTNLYYNSVALLGPDGNVAGVYRKRNNLLEASYNAEVWSPVPTYDTPYGRIGIVICADMFYAGFPRLAALQDINILLAPANVGITTDFITVRTWENDFSMIVANRWGTGGKGSKATYFNQDTFAIPSPFAYSFTYDARSVIMTNTGQVLSNFDGQQDNIGYGDLPIRTTRTLPVVRRPSLYSLIGQDTLEPYTFSQFGLPPPATFAVAGVDPGPSSTPWSAALTAVQNALAQAQMKGYTLRLIALPSNYFQTPDPTGMTNLQSFATANKVDVLVEFGGSVPPLSELIGSDGQLYTYSRTHRLRTESIPDSKLSPYYWVVDRDYARVAILQDVDLMLPETSQVMEKLGVDVVAMTSDTTLSVASAMWKSRTGDYYNIVMANLSGVEGVYLGGYPPGPQFAEANGLALMQLDTKYVRNKKESRFLDFTNLLLPCNGNNC
jgi:predicted amidohydrolase